jgi:hypothetical protein
LDLYSIILIRSAAEGGLIVMKESKLAGGRIGVHVPDHPKANNRGYVLRSRYVMEQLLGRYLLSGEVVHHKDGNKLNDVPENLDLMLKNEHDRKHSNCVTDHSRRLDYTEIARLRTQGLGYKKIAKATGYPLSSVKAAVKKMVTGSY